MPGLEYAVSQKRTKVAATPIAPSTVTHPAACRDALCSSSPPIPAMIALVTNGIGQHGPATHCPRQQCLIRPTLPPTGSIPTEDDNDPPFPRGYTRVPPVTPGGVKCSGRCRSRLTSFSCRRSTSFPCSRSSSSTSGGSSGSLGG